MNFHCLLHNILPKVPMLRQKNPSHSLPTYLFKFHFNIILLYMPMPAKWFLPSGFPHQNLAHVSLVFHSYHELMR